VKAPGPASNLAPPGGIAGPDNDPIYQKFARPRTAQRNEITRDYGTRSWELLPEPKKFDNIKVHKTIRAIALRR
jgi:hypothetical protein